MFLRLDHFIKLCSISFLLSFVISNTMNPFLISFTVLYYFQIFV